MPSSYSTSLRFELQFTGENLNVWGEKLSNTLARVDDAIAGFLSIAITGSTSLTTSNNNASADQARRAALKFTGTLSANSTITIPAVSKLYEVWNATDKVLTFTTGAGDTVSVDAGDITSIFCDGANVKTTTFGGYALKDYITSISASSGAVPGTTGHEGKFLKVTVDGDPSTWQQIQSTDIGDFEIAVRRRTLVYSLVFKGF